MSIYRCLEHPQIYKLVIKIFALGGLRGKTFFAFFNRLLGRECRGQILEIGSGPCQFKETYLKYLDNYVVTDINLSYLQDSQSSHHHLWYAVCDAALLPFTSHSFDRIFALYLFHHLSDEQVVGAIAEAQRCLRPEGKMIMADLFLPEKSWQLFGWLIAWLDRGEHVRRRAAMIKLIEQSGRFCIAEEFIVPGVWPSSMSAYVLTLK